VVDENGNVGEFQLLRDIGDGCGDAAIAAIKKTSGKWHPGVQNNKNVKVYYTFPFDLSLQ
jgi:protein TonB